MEVDLIQGSDFTAFIINMLMFMSIIPIYTNKKVFLGQKRLRLWTKFHWYFARLGRA